MHFLKKCVFVLTDIEVSNYTVDKLIDFKIIFKETQVAHLEIVSLYTNWLFIVGSKKNTVFFCEKVELTKFALISPTD